ncbi:pyridoxamine 5'-phosphate oxidase family protein [Bradyrhizobium sp. CSA112]|uniref:pyridoxamine 5'-phosphate oxidase family protein n=1 Tax=Bradyrhizobium sp. CSA112 TaxID=2699170 RepID=UPI0023AF44BA|nr:pyridoxamine 5'-phosphate oxidase family protein [Bradyrhizobium sp. CSA112]MDE5455607.1 pyridoxamine 5'-phosphate oxidase family protein [Bradyrhizobium sp. CSA112]
MGPHQGRSYCAAYNRRGGWRAPGAADGLPSKAVRRHTLWFLTFRHSSKLRQIRDDDHVLVAYVKPEKYEYVAISGRARIVEDQQKLKELWFEGLRVWFPKGPDDPELALLAIEVEKADYWADPASIVTYAFAYVRTRLTGQSPSPDEIDESKSVHFRREGS